MKLILTLFLSTLLCSAKQPLNVIVIFTDDQGYNDSAASAPKSSRPPTSTSSPKKARSSPPSTSPAPSAPPPAPPSSPPATPSASGMRSPRPFPKIHYGLNPKEHTIADHFSSHGYATACVGKWHLGHLPEVLPIANGFDTYLRHSLLQRHESPRQQGKAQGWPRRHGRPLEQFRKHPHRLEHPLDGKRNNHRAPRRPTHHHPPLHRQGYRFIEKSTAEEKPFFLYLPHSMPHIPLYVPDEIQDKDPKRAYINVIEHIDTQVGRIITTLREKSIAENTLVVFTTDNGPWLRFKHHGGSAPPAPRRQRHHFRRRTTRPLHHVGSQSHRTRHHLRPNSLHPRPPPHPRSSHRNELSVTHKIYEASTPPNTVLTNKPSPRDEFVYYTSRGDFLASATTSGNSSKPVPPTKRRPSSSTSPKTSPKQPTSPLNIPRPSPA